MALQSTTGHHVASILLLISQVSSGMCRRRYVSVQGVVGMVNTRLVGMVGVVDTRLV